MNQNSSLLTKRLSYQINYRGYRELEIILGKFAREHLEQFDTSELIEFEEILASNDADLLDWLLNKIPTPAELRQNKVWRMLQEENKNLNLVNKKLENS